MSEVATVLPAGPCLRCQVPLPERPLVAGAGYCDPCRDVEVMRVEAEVAKAREVTAARAKRLAEDMGLEPLEDEVGDPPAKLVQVLPKPRSLTCTDCGAVGLAYRPICGPCADAREAKRVKREREAEKQEVARQVATEEAQRVRWANMPPETRRLETLLPRQEVRRLSEAMSAVRSWMMGEGLPWLVLTGDWGVGKSHLAEGAVRALVERGEYVRWQPVVNLLTEMRRMVAAKADMDGFLDRVKITPWLVLDDLGRERATDWAQEALYRLVQGRQVSRLRTLVTTNETKASLGDRVGGAIADRVFDRSLVREVVLQGPSWR